MNELLHKIKKNEYLPYVAFFICMLIIHYDIQLVDGSDDDFMSSAFSTGNFQQLYANNRVVVNFIGAFLMSFNINVWKTLNILLLLFFMIRIFRFSKEVSQETDKNNDSILICGICFLFFLIPFNVLSSGAFWVTGTFNYLWALYGSFLVISPFLEDMFNLTIKKLDFVIGVIVGIYACNTEQTFLVVTFFGITYLLYSLIQRKKIKIGMLIYGILIIIECLPILFLPFNSNRAIGEQKVYYPNFDMLSILDKIYQGAMHYYDHLVNHLALLFFLISLFVLILAYKNVKSKLFHVIATLPVLYFFYALLSPITILQSIVDLEADWNLFDFSKMLYQFGMGKRDFIPFLFSSFIFILLFFLLIYVLNDLNQKCVVAFLYLTGIAEGMMMSFAPSIFISGNRVYFAPDILFLVITAILSKITLSNLSIKKPVKKIMLSIMIFSNIILSIVMGIMQGKGVVY